MHDSGRASLTEVWRGRSRDFTIPDVVTITPPRTSVGDSGAGLVGVVGVWGARGRQGEAGGGRDKNGGEVSRGWRWKCEEENHEIMIKIGYMHA